MIKRFGRNTAGRDLAVGDIHGHFTRLQAALDAVGFDPAVDRLFSVGDLVDRGPDSIDVDCWVLRRPWFHAVRGNHEQMTIERSDMHFLNGGAWFCGLSSVDQDCYAVILADLPLAIEIETLSGVVGVVHADIPRDDWAFLVAGLKAGGPEAVHIEAMCQWSRRRIDQFDESGVSGIRAVICGHTPVRSPVVLGNVYHIDTGGWLPDGSGHFTLLNLETLEVEPHK
ncbi:MAG: metallophosphoesterase [Pseudomonadaceae bacterium]|nr:metallophosphoesterase [Pseudomonadaceae bacterium]